MGRQFSVDPEELSQLARQFDATAGRLAGALTRFAAERPHRDAFGLLPEALIAHQRYEAKAEQSLDGLRAVHIAFRDALAGGLRAAVANYTRADQDSIPT